MAESSRGFSMSVMVSSVITVLKMSHGSNRKSRGSNRLDFLKASFFSVLNKLIIDTNLFVIHVLSYFTEMSVHVQDSSISYISNIQIKHS